MKNYLHTYLLCLLLIFFLSACQGAEPPLQLLQPTNTPLPIPQAGKATMVGQVLSVKNGSPIQKVAVRLARIYRQGNEGAFALDVAHSPMNYTDANGKFIIENFDPAEYLIVIGEPSDNNYVIYQDKDSKPYTYNAEVGKTIDVGVIKVNFTP